MAGRANSVVGEEGSFRRFILEVGVGLCESVAKCVASDVPSQTSRSLQPNLRGH
jgi:hypothetical protein